MESMINYSKSFSYARRNLPKDIAAKTEKSLQQLFDDEHSKGLHQEKIYDDIYSARVDDNYRIIYSKISGTVIVMYVGAHEDAYAWAKKHKVSVNEYIGAAQIVENIPPKIGRDSKTQKRVSRLAILTNDQMDALSIPREWWDSLRTSVFTNNNLLPYRQFLSEETLIVLEEVLNGETDIDELLDFYKEVASSSPEIPPIQKIKIEQKPIFEEYSDEELVKVGIPINYLDIVRSIKDDQGLNRLEKKLPETVIQSLYALKAGISIEEIYRTTFADSKPIKENDLNAALKNPVSLAEISPIPDKEALKAMMEYPMEQWRAFLHPAQRRLVERDYAGPARIIGGAGTGKTVVIVHRAKYLAGKCQPNRKVLVTTYGRTLAEDIASRLKMICSQTVLERIEVTTVDSLSKRLAKLLNINIVYEGAKSREGLGNLTIIWFNRIGGLNVPWITPVFCMEEWQDVIQAQRIKTLEEYLNAKRESRGKRLDRKARELLWPIFEDYRNYCLQTGIADSDFAQNLCADYLIEHTAGTQYSHILVDECQDLRAPAFRLLRAVAGKQHENDLYFSGDSRQRIYKGKASLSQCGVIVNNRSTELKVNYRTTAEIFEAAAKIQKGFQYDDLDGKEIPEIEYVCIAHGEKPRVIGFKNENDEIGAIAEDIRKNMKAGITDSELCVVARIGPLVSRIASGLRRLGLDVLVLDGRTKDDPSIPGIRVATMHRVKGVEYTCMYVAYVNNEYLPLKYEIKHAEGDASTLEIKKQEANLLSVAMTRAKKKVMITYTGKPSPFLIALE